MRVSRRFLAGVIAALLAGGSAIAQTAAPVAPAASGALLRALDKVTAKVVEFPVAAGESVTYGSLTITLVQCRTTPTGDSTAQLTVTDKAVDGTVAQAFSGWMFASSPSLSAMDHPLYDVWVARCTAS